MCVYIYIYIYIYTHTYTYPFTYSFPRWFVTGYWIPFPGLCSRTLLFIHPICTSLQLLTPDSHSFPPVYPATPPTHPWQPQVCSLCPWFCFETKYISLTDNKSLSRDPEDEEDPHKVKKRMLHYTDSMDQMILKGHRKPGYRWVWDVPLRPQYGAAKWIPSANVAVGFPPNWIVGWAKRTWRKNQGLCSPVPGSPSSVESQGSGEHRLETTGGGKLMAVSGKHSCIQIRPRLTSSPVPTLRQFSVLCFPFQ